MEIILSLLGLLIVAYCILLMVVWWFDQGTFYTRQVFYDCPHCHKQLTYVYHKCPDCHRVHKNLYPGLSHIFYVRCKCGRILTTLGIFGRTKYVAYCPKCMSKTGKEYELYRPEYRRIKDNINKEPQIVTFPLAGVPSSGKTTFLMSSIQALRTIAREHKQILSFPLMSCRYYGMEMERLFRNGIIPVKTNERIPEAFCIDFLGRELAKDKHLYLYDPAGELFTNDYYLLKPHTFWKNMSGLIFIVDPFALRGVKEKRRYLGIQNPDNLVVCEEDQEKCLNRLLNSLENRKRNRSKGQKKLNEIPCAIVVTKVDALNFNVDEETICNPYLKKDAESSFCRDWLQRQGAGNLVNTLEVEFGKCHYFFVSSLGKRTPGTSGAFQPFGIEEVWHWLLNETKQKNNKTSKDKINKMSGAFSPFEIKDPQDWLLNEAEDKSNKDEIREFLIIFVCSIGIIQLLAIVPLLWRLFLELFH